MRYLLQLEWKKLSTNRLFLATIGLYLVLLPLLYLTVKSGTNMDPESKNPLVSIYQSFYQFPGIWDTMTYLASWLTFFLITYLMLFSITSETNNKTLRQNLITGMSRSQWLTAKVLMLLALVLATVLYTFLVTLIAGSLAEGYGRPLTRHLWALFRFGVQSFFYGSLAIFLALVFRRGGLALMVFFAYLLIIERIVRYLIFGTLLKHLEWGSYFPANLAWDTVPFFMVRRVPGIMDGDVEKILIDPNVATTGILGYTLLLLGASYALFHRRDL